MWWLMVVSWVAFMVVIGMMVHDGKVVRHKFYWTGYCLGLKEGREIGRMDKRKRVK